MKKNRVIRLLVHLVLIFAGILFLAPFLWMISTSLKPDTQIFTATPKWIPNPISWENYLQSIKYIPFFLYLKNTIIITLLSTIGAILSCPLIAYSFARLNWQGRNIIFFLTISVMMIPGEVTMIPMYLFYNKLHLVGTPFPLILHTYFGVPFFIFLLRQFFRGIPKDLEDAARMDGAGEFRIYRQIMLPLAKPAVLAIGLFQFMASWTDFMGPLLYLNDNHSYTLSIGLQQFQSQMGTEWGMMMAAATLMTLPLIVLFFLLQKTFIQGVTFSGIKG